MIPFQLANKLADMLSNWSLTSSASSVSSVLRRNRRPPLVQVWAFGCIFRNATAPDSSLKLCDKFRQLPPQENVLPVPRRTWPTFNNMHLNSMEISFRNISLQMICISQSMKKQEHVISCWYAQLLFNFFAIRNRLYLTNIVCND